MSGAKRIAIIGSGISGLGCAWFLHRDFEITVFEAENRLGGHTHTVEVDEEGRRIPIDTGFMVFNRVTYPNLVRLFERLQLPVKPTDMSFSVHCAPRDLEFCGSSLNHLFAQRRNLLRPSFYRLLVAINRFNQDAMNALADPGLSSLSLEDYVRQGGYGEDFLHLYLIPMSSAVWSTPPEKMLRFPAASLLRFFHNHGFLGMHTQHPWWTVEGGASSYIRRLTQPFDDRIHRGAAVRMLRRGPGGLRVVTDHGEHTFDKVILACHAPSALEILGAGATDQERRVLGAFRYEPNEAILHTDEGVMPRRRLAWSSWNYRLDLPASAVTGTAGTDSTRLPTSTHYWMNRLQGVSDRRNYFVSINGAHLVDPTRILRRIPCEHPLFDREAAAAQEQVPGLNAGATGRTETYFAGAWQRYGFHEDGLLSAVQLSGLLLERDPWTAAT
jgi:predicted NAD/FAD-binding protein